MRKKPPADDRPSRHDDLVAALLAHIPALIKRAGVQWTRLGAPDKVETERPCGKGDIDLAVIWRELPCPAEHDCDGTVTRALIVEVKSELEHWTAGGVARQLKGYKRNFDQRCTSDALVPIPGDRLRYKRGHLEGTPHSALILYSGRSLTDAELTLLRHERIIPLVAVAKKPNAGV